MNATFKYHPEIHNMVMVDEGGYNSCKHDPNHSIYSTTGNNTIMLIVIGDMCYFISCVGGDCERGMKTSIGPLLR